MGEQKLFGLSDQYKELRDQKSELELQLKTLNGEIEILEQEMVDLMTEEELSNFNRNGCNFSLVVREFPSPVPERKDELYELMKKQGFEYLFTINAQTLQATVKDLKEGNDDVLPEWLDGLIKISEKPGIRLTKGRKA